MVLVVPLNLAFGNPDLLERIGLGPGAQGHRRGAAVQERRADRQPAPQRPLPDSEARRAEPGRLPGGADAAGLLRRRASTSGRSTSSAGATTACRPTTRWRAPTGWSRRPTSGDHRRAHASFAGDPEVDASRPIDDPDILDFMSLRDRSRGRTVPLDSPDARGARRLRRPPHAARGAAAGDLRERRQARRLRRDGRPRSTSAAPSSASSSSRCGRSSSRTCATATGSSTLRRPALKDIAKRYGIDYKHTLGEIIELNTDEDVGKDVFTIPA